MIAIAASDPGDRGIVGTAMDVIPSEDPMTCRACGEVHARCAGHVKNGPRAGKPCTHHPIRGGTVCTHHGGGAPQVRAAANRRLAELRRRGEVGKLLAELGGDVEARHPLDALLDRHDEADAWVRLLTVATAALRLRPTRMPAPANSSGSDASAEAPDSLYGPDHTGDGAAHVLVDMLGTWTDRHARIAKLLLDHDVDQRKLRLESARREAVFAAVMVAADATFADPEQRQRFGEELARSLQRQLAESVVAVDVSAA